MKIRFAIIKPEILAQISAKVSILQSAVNAGDMDGVDDVTDKLVAMTTDCQSVDLTEEEWRAFLEGIRRRNPAFQSNYLLPGEIFSEILPTVAAGDLVLELPIDGELGKESPDV